MQNKLVAVVENPDMAAIMQVVVDRLEELAIANAMLKGEIKILRKLVEAE